MASCAFGAGSNCRSVSLAPLPRRATCIRASSIFRTAATDADALKLRADILAHVAGLGRGFYASNEDVELADELVKKLENSSPSVDLSRDLDLLQGRWKLLFSSAFSSGNLGGSRPGPPDGRLPFQLRQVYQRIDVLSREFDNIVDIRIATPWPLPPVDARATLAHTFELTGEAGVVIKFDRTYVKPLGVLSELPPIELPKLPDFVSSSSQGQFVVTYVNGSFRVTRGDRGELRIFARA